MSDDAFDPRSRKLRPQWLALKARRAAAQKAADDARRDAAKAQDAATSTLGRASLTRDASSGAAKPPNTTECTAPMRAQASMAATASGTITQVIPPSLVLVVLADQMGKSVGDMYKGALLPGLALVGVYLAYVFFLTLARPHAAPAMPASARTLHGSALLLRVLDIHISIPIDTLLYGLAIVSAAFLLAWAAEAAERQFRISGRP